MSSEKRERRRGEREGEKGRGWKRERERRKGERESESKQAKRGETRVFTILLVSILFLQI